MLVKTSTLIGTSLDWAVLKANGQDFTDFNLGFMDAYPFSTDWAQGGPIIERDALDLSLVTDGKWRARHRFDLSQPARIQHGSTPLIAAMRCYVASKFGDEVQIPDELQGE